MSDDPSVVMRASEPDIIAFESNFRGRPMTEQEWLECTDPHAMLLFLGRKVSDRKG
jgi:hypothetical protein